MIKYTAKAFAEAQFATHPDGRIAARVNPEGWWPWAVSTDSGNYDVERDNYLTRDGWTPVNLADLTARAEKAERSRDLAIARAERAECHDCVTDAAAIEQPRALTPDAITDAMVKRAVDAQRTFGRNGGWITGNRCVRAGLVAALTEPPTRPEGAEEIESQIEAWSMSPDGGALNAPQHRTLADHLAAQGVRVTGAES